MKIIKRIVLLMLTFCFMIICIDATKTYAYTNTHSMRGSQKFEKEWEYTKTYKVGNTVIATMVFGFDTDYVNEDYVWTKSTECYSTAGVFRDGYDTKYVKGTETGKKKYSKIEVKHRTYYVNYRIELSATYTGVTNSIQKTNIK